MNQIRRRFLDEHNDTVAQADYLVVAVKLPTGAIELITNTASLTTKCQYYVDAYDDDFRLKANKDIQIVGYMLV